MGTPNRRWTAAVLAFSIATLVATSAQSAHFKEYGETRYPIVLIPGLLGFDSLFGIVDYFAGIPEALTDAGAEVYFARGSLTNSSELRAAQLLPQLEEIAAISGADKLNLIAHSQGAIDARILAAMRPDLIASVTSVGGPHLGAPLADLVARPVIGALPAAGLGILADLIALITGSEDPNDVRAAMRFLSRDSMADFNRRYPAAIPATRCGQGAAVVDGVHYFSWSGVGSLTNPIDLLDVFWTLTSLISEEPNDGLVGRCSSHLGTVIRDNYFHNHIDETNMLVGLIFAWGAKPPTLFRTHANRLKNAGL